MVLSEFFYIIGFVFSTVLLAVALLAIPFNVRTPKSAWQGTMRVKWHELSEQQRSDREDRRRTRLRRWSILGTISAAFLLWAFASGEVAAHMQAAEQQEAREQQDRVSSLVSYTEQTFVDPVTPAEAERILDGEHHGFTVVLPDGEERVIDFKPNNGFYIGFERMSPSSDEEAAELRDAGWLPDADAQRKWRMEAVLFPKLEDAYGVMLTPGQREELDVPGVAPDHLTRYGSTEMTTLLEDGTYFNGVVTLIWDGEFKLIGSEGTDRAQELTRR